MGHLKNCMCSELTEFKGRLNAEQTSLEDHNIFQQTSIFLTSKFLLNLYHNSVTGFIPTDLLTLTNCITCSALLFTFKNI